MLRNQQPPARLRVDFVYQIVAAVADEAESLFVMLIAVTKIAAAAVVADVDLKM